MMSVVAICLVVTSLATASVWSPSPKNHGGEDVNVIVKDGHRVVVVEYDEDGHPNTKVSISPEYENPPSSATEQVDEAVKTAEMEETDRAFAPKEFICDAFGRCKHRFIATTLGKAKDKVSEEVHGMKEAAKDAKDALGGTLGKARESVSYKAHEAEERARGAVEGAKETGKEQVKEAKDAVGDAIGKARESVSRRAHEAGERAGEAAKTTKDAAKAGMDLGKTIAGHVAGNVSEAAKSGCGKVREKSEKAEEASRHAKDGIEEFGKKYLWWQWHGSWSSIMSLVSKLGFVTAYGMCMWVTFISSYVLAGALPRHQFGMVQSNIYPLYFRAMATSIGEALLGCHSLSLSEFAISAKPHMIQSQAYNLLGSLLMALANMLYLEPRATKVMFERMKLEKEEGRGREHLSGEASRTLDAEGGGGGTGTLEKSGEEVRSRIARRLRNLNTYSSLLNILTLMSLTWHLVYLSQRLASTC